MQWRKKCLFLIICAVISSCAAYTDGKRGKVALLDGYIEYGEGHNVLVYESKQKFRSDDELVAASPYHIKLPKNIKRFSVGTLGKCWVDYGHRQFILISQNDRPQLKDSSMVTEDDYQKLVRGKFEIGKLHQLKIDEFELMNGRRSLLINRDSVSIILYNIKNKNFKPFLSQVRRY